MTKIQIATILMSMGKGDKVERRIKEISDALTEYLQEKMRDLINEIDNNVADDIKKMWAMLEEYGKEFDSLMYDDLSAHHNSNSGTFYEKKSQRR